MQILLMAFISLISIFSYAESTLNIAIPNKITTLNPAETIIAQDRFTLPLIFEYLVEADGNGEIKNRLISEWAYVGATNTLRLKMSKGHYFSDGKEVTSKDVENSFRQLCSPGSKAVSQFIGLVGCGLKEPGTQVRSNGEFIDFKIDIHPNAFLYQLAYGRAPIFRYTDDGRSIGSGPFQLSSLSDDTVVLTKNTHSRQKVDFDKLVFRYVSEVNLRSALANAEVDVAAMYLESTLPNLDGINFTKLSHSPNITQTLVLNTSRKPFNDLQYTLAFKQKIQDLHINKCKNLPAATGLIPKGVPGYKPEMQLETKIKFKKVERRQTVHFYRHIDRRDGCEESIIKQAANEMGLSAEFIYLDNYPELIKHYLDPHTNGYIELIPFIARDPSPILHRFAPGSSDGYYFYQSDSIRQLLEDALKLPTVSERIPIYRSINQLLHDNTGIQALYYVGHTLLVSPCLDTKKIDQSSYNPNSFLYLLNLEVKSNCRGVIN